MKVATAEQMHELDRKAMETYHIPGIVLMENAGRGAAEAVEEAFPDLQRKKIAIFAGKGNNGGDGFVVARHLLNRGISAKVFLLTNPQVLRGDAETNFHIFKRMKGEIFSLPSTQEYQKVKKDLEKYDLLIDGIFGTGLDAEVRGYYREVIDHLNGLQKPIVALDIPSGLDANTGKPLGTAIRATMTITFGLPKVGHLIHPGPEYVGKLRVIDISFPKMLVEEEKIQTHLIEESEIRRWLALPRKPETHKGDYGHLLVLAGSVGKTGAAAMACEAALRVGAGLVTLGIPKSLNPIMETKLTEVMTEPLPETPKQTLSLRALDTVLRLCENKKAVVIGPGLGTVKETQALMIKLIKMVKLPLIVDADGLTALAAETKFPPFKSPGAHSYPSSRRDGKALEVGGEGSPGRPDRCKPELLRFPASPCGPERIPDPYRQPGRPGLHQPHREPWNGLGRNGGRPHRNDGGIRLSGLRYPSLSSDVGLPARIGRRPGFHGEGREIPHRDGHHRQTPRYASGQELT